MQFASRTIGAANDDHEDVERQRMLARLHADLAQLDAALEELWEVRQAAAAFLEKLERDQPPGSLGSQPPRR
jgi:hypothetical protein